MSETKRVHENLKQLTFTKSDDPYHPLHVRIQTPSGVDVGLWLDRWQTVEVVSWLHQHLVSSDSMIAQMPSHWEEGAVEERRMKIREGSPEVIYRVDADGNVL